jgi:hypothetical protein
VNRMALHRASLIAICLVGLGCERGNRVALEQIQQQRADMKQQHEQWSAELGRWESEHAAMKRWHAEHPMPSSDTGKLRALRDHVTKLARHEEEVASFRKDLAALESRMEQGAGGRERDQVAAHAAVWAQHVKLKATYELLENAHRGLLREYAALTGDSTGHT